MVISPDGKFLYISSKAGQKNDNLICLEIKTDKIVKTINGISLGDAIGISVDNKKLYLSYNDSKNLSYKINCIDINTFKIIHQIDFKANCFSFTVDGKYLLATGDSEVAIINIATSEIVSKIRVASTPEGIAFPNDGTALIWLPQENRLISIDLAQQLKNEKEFNQESNLNAFKNELRNSSTLGEFENAKQIFADVNTSINASVQMLIKDLGNSFGDLQTGYNMDYKHFVFTNQLGIISIIDNDKKIWPLFLTKIINDQLVISIKGTGNDTSEEVYRSPLKSVDWIQVKLFIRNYFLVRLKELK